MKRTGPPLSAEVLEMALEQTTSSLHRNIARQSVETAKALNEVASLRLERAHSHERFYELDSAAICYVGKGGLKKKFGEISNREREIAINAAFYVLFGHVPGS